MRKLGYVLEIDLKDYYIFLLLYKSCSFIGVGTEEEGGGEG